MSYGSWPRELQKYSPTVIFGGVILPIANVLSECSQ